MRSWFGFYLVNTDFQWPDVLWGHWIQQHVVNDATSHIHNIFVRNVTTVMIRYSDCEIVKGQFNDIPDDCAPKDNNNATAMEDDNNDNVDDA